MAFSIETIATFGLLFLTIVVLYMWTRRRKVSRTSSSSAPSIPKKELSVEHIMLANKLELSPTVPSMVTISLAKGFRDAREYSGLLEFVTMLSAFANVVVMQHAEDEEEKNRLSLDAMQLFQGVLPVHRLLYYSTDIGKTAIVRQLCPRFHIEENRVTSTALAPHVRVYYLNSSGDSPVVPPFRVLSTVSELLA